MNSKYVLQLRGIIQMRAHKSSAIIYEISV